MTIDTLIERFLGMIDNGETLSNFIYSHPLTAERLGTLLSDIADENSKISKRGDTNVDISEREAVENYSLTLNTLKELAEFFINNKNEFVGWATKNPKEIRTLAKLFDRMKNMPIGLNGRDVEAKKIIKNKPELKNPKWDPYTNAKDNSRQVTFSATQTSSYHARKIVQ